uniref:U59-Liphistoxin-Lth1a_1 n=1 Tax=Liphistius thaleban TaxID=1905330 RepID=A0A4Q8K4M8_9ARAC
MTTQIFAAILGLAMVSILSFASESEESALREEISELLKEISEVPQPQERECRWFWGTCNNDGDCCKHLGCKRKWPHICLWDGTFTK